MCETLWAYYGVFRYEGKEKFNYGTVGAADEDAARMVLRSSAAKYLPGEPELHEVRLGWLETREGKRPFKK